MERLSARRERGSLPARLALGLALGLVAPPLLVRLGAERQPALAVRTVPHFAHTGRVTAAQPPGQLFVCAEPGLWRIELRPVGLGPLPTTPLELVLREGGPGGAVLRRASFLAGRDAVGEGRVRFDFEPLEESAGRLLHFELRPGEGAEDLALGVWTRTPGQRGASAPWGPARLEGERHELEFQAPFTDLSGAVVACARLDPEHVLRASLHDAQGALLRETHVTGVLVRDGHAHLRFEPPLADCYGDRLRLVLEPSPGVVLRGRGETPSYATLHGCLPERPAGAQAAPFAREGAVLALTRGGIEEPGYALAFRAFARESPLRTLLARAGARVLPAYAAWLVLVLVVLLVPLGRTAGDGAPASYSSERR